jgi:hypothetical protein
MVKINGIPVYDAVICSEECGMQRISLVDSPAVMSNFVALAEQKKMQMYSVTDADKQLVRGVVMRADFPIYRRDDNGEYYIIYKAETIREMAEKYLDENRQNAVNLMHQGEEIEGVQMIQYFIKDKENGIAPVGYDEIADGSLFAEFHITNEEVWKEVKEGTYKGFSLEGVFGLQPNTDQEEVEDIVEKLDGKFSKNKLMSKLQKIKEMLSKMAEVLVTCGSVATDKAILYWDGDEDLKVGDAVYIDNEGEQAPAEDGDYVAEDGKTIVVAEGKVSEIKDAEVAEEGTEETNTETEVSANEKFFRIKKEMYEQSYDERYRRIYDQFYELLGSKAYVIEASDTYAIVEEYDDEYNLLGVFRYDIEVTDDAVTINADSKVEVERAWVEKGKKEGTEDTTTEEMEQLRKENENLRIEIEELKKQPLAKSVEEEVETSVNLSKTGNKKMDNLAKIMLS